MSKMLERDVEGYFVEQIKKIGGEHRKVQWIGRNSAPDRVVFYGGTHWVELKRPGEQPRDDQLREHARMQEHGAKVWVLDTPDAVDLFIVFLVANNRRPKCTRLSD